MSGYALLFPGQGSQSLGMMSALADSFPIVQETFAESSAALGYDLWDLVINGPEEKLNQTEFTQPALLTADIAAWRVWQQQMPLAPRFMAGHSLGEYSALVAAGCIGLADAVVLVAKRGRYMQEAVPVGTGAMAAIIGLSDTQVAELCEQVDGVVSPANINSIGQIVVAGEKAAVEAVVAKAPDAGAKLAKLIPVSVPSHCQLMAPAAEHLQADIDALNWQTPNIPVIQNVDVMAHTDVADLKKALVSQLTSPVRWVETIQTMNSARLLLFGECGPGKVLAGLVKRIDRACQVVAMDNPDSQQALISAVKEA